MSNPIFMATPATSRRWMARADTRRAALKAAQQFDARWAKNYNFKGGREYYEAVNARAIKTLKEMQL